MTTTPDTQPAPTPKPSAPVRALQPVATGLNQDAPEMRRRIVAMLLPYMRDTDDLLEVASWIETGDDSTTDEDES